MSPNDQTKSAGGVRTPQYLLQVLYELPLLVFKSEREPRRCPHLLLCHAMAAKTIGFPCFVITNGELSSTFYTAKALADDFVTSITAALAMGLGNGLLTPFITLWKPRESIPRQGSYQRLQSSLLQHDHDLSKFCDNISGQGDRIIADVFGGLTKARAPTLVAFIAQHKPVGGAQAAIGLKPQHEEHAGVVAKLEREFREVVRLSRASGSPSQNCRPSNYRRNQLSPVTAILDGRYADTPITIAPPVEDFHYVFASFVAESRNENMQPPDDFVREVSAVMDAVAQIGMDELPRQTDTRTLLSRLLSVTFGQPANSNRTSADHILTFSRDSPPLGRAALAIVEETFEPGSSHDGSVQGSFSYVQHWTDPSQKALLEACSCPSFVISLAGSYINMCGVIFTGHAIVHRLTDYIWLANSRVNDDAHSHRIARVFFALGNALARLRSFYAELVKPSIPRARFFPLANRYRVGERTIEFRYTAYLKTPGRPALPFWPSKCDGDARQIVVKFVERYGVAAHTLLANHGLAPRLLSYGDIWLSGPEERGCGSRKMVVMEYVEGMTAHTSFYSEAKGALPDGVHGIVERERSR